MEVFIYKAKSLRCNLRYYFVVPSNAEMNALPPEVREEIKGSEPFKKTELERGEQRIALDADEALANIQRCGYHIQGAVLGIEIRIGDKRIQ